MPPTSVSNAKEKVTPVGFGWSVSLVLITMIGTLVGGGIYDIKNEQVKLRKQQAEDRTAITALKTGHVTQVQLRALWQAVSEIRGITRPPDPWRIRINNNTVGIAELRMFMGLNSRHAGTAENQKRSDR